MRTIAIQNVRYGMVISPHADGSDKTQVRRVEIEPQGCKSRVHLNGQECWDYGYPVYVVGE